MSGKKELLWDEDGPSCIAHTEKNMGGETGVTNGRDPPPWSAGHMERKMFWGLGSQMCLAFLKGHVTSELR